MELTLSCACGFTTQLVVREGASIPCPQCGTRLAPARQERSVVATQGVGFALLAEPPPPSPELVQQRRREALVGRIDGLIANLTRSLHALESQLPRDERDRLLASLDGAKERRDCADFADDAAEEVARRLEDAATRLGQLMLRL